MRTLVWNLRWARPESPRGKLIHQQIAAANPDIAILTETAGLGFFEGGEAIRSSSDYGYPAPDHRRKVHLWSRWGWRDIDPIGTDALPPGRFVAATTETPAGPLRVIGVCIPWSAAHVSTGRKDRRRWEDHERYLRGMQQILEAAPAATPLLLGGDFNQRIPRKRQPQAMHRLLIEALEPRLALATGGTIPVVEKHAIDHLCHTSELGLTSLRGIPPEHPSGINLSDHFGLVVELERGGSR